MSRVLWVLLVLVAVVSVALRSHAQPATAGQAEPPLAAGVIVYRANYCGVCHELPAAETRGTFGPTHAGMGATAAERLLDPAYGGAATTPAEYLAESILQPGVYLVPGYATSAHPMPSFVHLPEADIAALVELLLAQ